MKLRVLFAIPIVLLAMFPLTLVAAFSAEYPLLLLAQTAPPDNDGDTLLDEFDPDDDNDGVADFGDPEPFNPAVPSSKAPGVVDPGQSPSDNDGDTLLDDYDLDDDNDGKADVNDPEPFNLPPPGAPPHGVDTPSAPDTTDREPTDPATDHLPASVPLVTSLPSTGSGNQSPELVPDWVVGLVIAAATAVINRIRSATRA